MLLDLGEVGVGRENECGEEEEDASTGRKEGRRGQSRASSGSLYATQFRGCGSRVSLGLVDAHGGPRISLGQPRLNRIDGGAILGWLGCAGAGLRLVRRPIGDGLVGPRSRRPDEHLVH